MTDQGSSALNTYQVRQKADGFFWVEVTDPRGDEIDDAFDGSDVIGNRFEAIQIEFFRPTDDDDDCVAGDFHMNGITTFGVFSRRAVDALHDLLAPAGEFIPVVGLPGEYMAFHPLRAIEALDEDRSELKRFGSGRIMKVLQYEFKSELIVNAPVFCLRQRKTRHLFVSDAFRDRVQSAGLTGMSMPLVWSSAGADRVWGDDGWSDDRERMKRKSLECTAPLHESAVERPLSDEERMEVTGLQISAIKHFGLPDDFDPEKAQEHIHDEVGRVRQAQPSLSQDEGQQRALELGCLWAETICRACDWEWVSVSFEENEFYCIVSADRSHAVAPLHYMQDQLLGSSSTRTTRLFYNMIKSENLPPSKPNGYCLVGT